MAPLEWGICSLSPHSKAFFSGCHCVAVYGYFLLSIVEMYTCPGSPKQLSFDRVTSCVESFGGLSRRVLTFRTQHMPCLLARCDDLVMISIATQNQSTKSLFHATADILGETRRENHKIPLLHLVDTASLEPLSTFPWMCPRLTLLEEYHPRITLQRWHSFRGAPLPQGRC